MTNTYHNDDIIQIDHSPVSNSDASPQNAVGATDSLTLRTIDYTPSDANSIYVDGVNGLDTNSGTSASPVLTIEKANELVTASKSRIYIIDSSTYNELPMNLSSDLVGIYSAVGQTPTLNINIGDTLYNLTELVNTSTYPSHAGSCVLESGDIFVIYRDDNNKTSCKTIDGATFAKNDDETLITTSPYNHYACCLTADGNIFVSVRGTTGIVGYFVLDKTDYTNFIKTSTGVDTPSGDDPTCILKDNNDILMMWENGNTIYYAIISGIDYTIGTSKTLWLASANVPEINELPTGNFVVFYFKGSVGSWNLYYQEIQQDLTSVVAETLILSSIYNYHSEIVISSGHIVVVYDNDDYVLTPPSITMSYNVYDPGYNLIYSGLDSELGDTLELNATNINDSLFLLSQPYDGSSDYDLIYNILASIPAYIKTNSIVKFDGLIIESNFQRGVLYFVDQNEDLTFKHCTIQNIPKISGVDDIQFIKNQSDYDNVITNCAFINCYIRNLLTTNNADIQQNIFSSVPSYPAIEIDGNGSSIIFDHNTMFNCFGGILLTNNDGNEIIKNSIFHECVDYDVKCGTTLQITYCLQTGTLTTCTSDSNTLVVNPRFINEGIDYITNLDLNLKNKSLGYDYNSPAIGNASDSKDMGGYDRDISYSADTYSTIYIQKPDIVDIKYNAVNKVKNVNLDGTVRTYRSGSNKELVLKWTGILNEDFEKLLEFWRVHSGTVKVYLDPVTNPSIYESYYLDYNNINGSPKKSILLSETGVSDVEITLIKVYQG